jgi:hypothetical protein
VVGEVAGGETGEEAEGAVEGGDKGAGDEAAEGVWGDGELGDYPLGLGSGCDAEGCGEEVDLGGGEAVEEEVGDDEVVRRVGRVESAGVGLVGADTRAVAAGALEQGAEHGGAGVDGVDLDQRIGAEKAGGEAAVAVAEDEGVVDGGGFGEEGAAGSGEPGAEGEELHPAIKAGEAVEIRGTRKRVLVCGVRIRA